MSKIELGALWADLATEANPRVRFQPFPAGAPGAAHGEVHTAEVQSVSQTKSKAGQDRLELALINGPYSARIYFDLDSGAFAAAVGPAEEEEAYSKMLRKLRKLKTVATLLGLATPTGLDLAPAKLQAATGKVLRISVKDSGRTREAKNGLAYPQLYIDVLGSASALEPVAVRKQPVLATPQFDDDDIPF